MSCVVGLVDNGSVWIGADGIATTDDGEKRPIKARKIIRNRDYLFGYTGSVRTGQVIDPYYFKPPKNIFDLPDALSHTLCHMQHLILIPQIWRHAQSQTDILHNDH